MSSIRWIRNLTVDGQAVVVEMMMGTAHIGDKCYLRFNGGPELYFKPIADTRDGVMMRGVELLMQRFDGKDVRFADGRPYDWT